MKAYRWQALVALLLLVLTTMTVSAATPVDQASSDRASTLKIAIGNRVQDPTNMNLYAPGVSRSDTGLHQIVYEYFFYNNLQTGEFIPWLAESAVERASVEMKPFTGDLLAWRGFGECC